MQDMKNAAFFNLNMEYMSSYYPIIEVSFGFNCL